MTTYMTRRTLHMTSSAFPFLDGRSAIEGPILRMSRRTPDRSNALERLRRRFRRPAQTEQAEQDASRLLRTLPANATAASPVNGAARPHSPHGTQAKTVLTEIGPVTIEVPRDRKDRFEPGILRKRQRPLGGVDRIVVKVRDGAGHQPGGLCGPSTATATSWVRTSGDLDDQPHSGPNRRASARTWV
jgi:hypothetical protein